MTRFIIVRLLQGVLVIMLVYALSFWLLMATPGDPFVGSKQPPPSVVQALRKRYGLADPARAFVLYPWRVLTRGDLGPTITYQDWTVNDVIGAALPVSMALGAFALVIALWAGVGLGVAGALYRGRWPDVALTVLTLLGVSVPTFVTGSLLLMGFGVYWAVLPSGGWGNISQLVLPSITLSLVYLAYIARLTRVSVLDTLNADFVRTARAKGLPERAVIGNHVLRNAALPVLSFLGPSAAMVLTGSFVVEKLYAIPGLGEDFVNACLNKDIPLVLGCVLAYTVLVVVFNLLVDIACAFADPRITL